MFTQPPAAELLGNIKLSENDWEEKLGWQEAYTVYLDSL